MKTVRTINGCLIVFGFLTIGIGPTLLVVMAMIVYLGLTDWAEKNCA